MLINDCVYMKKIKRPRNFWVEIELAFDYSTLLFREVQYGGGVQ